MLISKLPEGLMDRCNNTVEVIRRKHTKEKDLLGLMQFVEDEMNGPLFTRETLQEYKKRSREVQPKDNKARLKIKKDADNGSDKIHQESAISVMVTAIWMTANFTMKF